MTITPPRMGTGARTALLALAGLLALSGCRPSGGGSLQYETASVVKRDMVQRVTATGTLSAVVSVDVGAQVSGKIVALHADFNSPVRKGQLVAQIDPTTYNATLAQAEGDLVSSRATVLLKAQNLERKKALFPQRASSQQDLDQAVAELAQAQATVTIKEAAVASARANLGYCQITSPVDGVVIARKVDIGQTVIAAMSTPVLFTVAQDLSKMNISATVSEADIGQVHAGQPVDFTVDAFPDETFHGVVHQVRKAPTTTQNVVTYETIISVDNAQQKLFPGMTADVAILVAEKKNVLSVPNAALRYAPAENSQFEQAPPRRLERGQRLVYAVAAGGKLRPLIVKAGISDGVDTEIVSGVEEGASVVTSTLSGAPRTGSGMAGPPGGAG